MAVWGPVFYVKGAYLARPAAVAVGELYSIIKQETHTQIDLILPCSK